MLPLIMIIMSIVFDIESSLPFWRKAYPLDKAPNELATSTPNAFSHRLREIHEATSQTPSIKTLCVDGVYHILCRTEAERGSSNKHRCHVWSGKIPFGSFYELKDEIYIESPAFMFLRAASLLSLPELIAFGDELCGFYSFDSSQERGFRQRKVPLTSKQHLKHFILSVKGCYGSARALRALQFVVDGSASPMETFDEMTMCLPYRLGGYNLPMLTMNRAVQLVTKAARIAKHSECRLDMSWKGFMLDIEHHGKYDHTTESDYNSDRARVNALKEMGFEVIELTAEQVRDLQVYEYIVERIARIIGKRIRKQYRGATPARQLLRKTLYIWNATSGRIRS